MKKPHSFEETSFPPQVKTSLKGIKHYGKRTCHLLFTNCAKCGQRFWKRTLHALYCSEKCSQAAKRARKALYPHSDKTSLTDASEVMATGP
jgi:hypothetical protein